MPRLASFLVLLFYATAAAAADGNSVPWWAWLTALFAVSFAIGIVAVLAGVGGGVLFVPIVGSFFPFHLDFVRGAGLLFALAGTRGGKQHVTRLRRAPDGQPGLRLAGRPLGQPRSVLDLPLPQAGAVFGQRAAPRAVLLLPTASCSSTFL